MALPILYDSAMIYKSVLFSTGNPIGRKSPLSDLIISKYSRHMVRASKINFARRNKTALEPGTDWDFSQNWEFELKIPKKWRKKICIWLSLWGSSEIHKPFLGSRGPGPMYRLNPATPPLHIIRNGVSPTRDISVKGSNWDIWFYSDICLHTLMAFDIFILFYNNCQFNITSYIQPS